MGWADRLSPEGPWGKHRPFQFDGWRPDSNFNAGDNISSSSNPGGRVLTRPQQFPPARRLSERAFTDQALHQTYLNRYRGQWRWLRRRAIPEVIYRAKAESRRGINVVIGAVSMGEEMARAYHEWTQGLIQAGEPPAEWDLQIHGIDISRFILDRAQRRTDGIEPFCYTAGPEALSDDTEQYVQAVIDTLNQDPRRARRRFHLYAGDISDGTFMAQFRSADMLLANGVSHQLNSQQSSRIPSAFIQFRRAWMAATMNLNDEDFLSDRLWSRVNLAGEGSYYFYKPAPAGAVRTGRTLSDDEIKMRVLKSGHGHAFEVSENLENPSVDSQTPAVVSHPRKSPNNPVKDIRVLKSLSSA